MAILSGTTSSAPVQGVSVSGPIDENPPTGAGIMGLNGKWVIDPGESFIVQALGVVAATANLDWTQAGYFTLTTTSGTNLTITFGTGSATGVPSATQGQLVKVRVTGAGTPTITWPGTVTWVGIIATPAVSASAPLVVNGVALDITLVCTLGGSAPTFDGTYITG